MSIFMALYGASKYIRHDVKTSATRTRLYYIKILCSVPIYLYRLPLALNFTELKKKHLIYFSTRFRA
jgi:hypothetical protein